MAKNKIFLCEMQEYNDDGDIVRRSNNRPMEIVYHLIFAKSFKRAEQLAKDAIGNTTFKIILTPTNLNYDSDANKNITSKEKIIYEEA